MNNIKVINPDITKNYYTSYEALEEFGYKKVPAHELPDWVIDHLEDGEENKVVEQNNEYFVYQGMDHSNSTIYEIELRQL